MEQRRQLLRRLLPVAFAAAFALGGCSSANVVPAANVTTGAALRSPLARNPIPPRLQWLGNYGYCGETSMISAGLYYGQYVSQYEARAIASRGIPQYRRRSQLLLGVNDVYAARRMHLDGIEFPTQRQQSTRQFELWIVRNVALGRPVIIGLYENYYVFNSSSSLYPGDPDYDHIVPVIAATRDGLTFSDNGLYGPPRRYLFERAFAGFARSRKAANAPGAPVYSLPSGADFGITIAGVTDPGHETLPVRVATNVNYERPAIKNGTSVRPKPMALVLTVTVRGLRKGVAYRLYRYDDFAAVPDRNFNANARVASKQWDIMATGSSYVVRERILSDQIAVYRAVPASGP